MEIKLAHQAGSDIGGETESDTASIMPLIEKHIQGLGEAIDPSKGYVGFILMLPLESGISVISSGPSELAVATMRYFLSEYDERMSGAGSEAIN
jgi:hypothetical protein